MKISKHVLIVFIAFVIGQFIQLIANAVAVWLYAYRPVTWCAFVAFATIVLVLLTLVVSSAEGEHIAKEKPMQEIVEEYATPPDDKSKAALYFCKKDLDEFDIDLA